MILQNQSLLDISIQEYGNLEGLYDLALTNNISVTDALMPGNVLDIPNIETKTPDIKRYYKNKDLHPATAITANKKITADITTITADNTHITVDNQITI